MLKKNIKRNTKNTMFKKNIKKTQKKHKHKQKDVKSALPKNF